MHIYAKYVPNQRGLSELKIETLVSPPQKMFTAGRANTSKRLHDKIRFMKIK